MNSPPLIGITSYGRNEKNYYRLPAKYVEAVRRAGATPLLLPPGEPNVSAMLARLDGLIFSGGGDIAPDYYNSQRHEMLYGINIERDKSELALARAITERDMPTLCICRGIQVLNVALGGTLIEHLPDVVGDQIAHRAPIDPISGKRIAKPPLHPVVIEAGSRLSELIGATRVHPASSHHQSLRRVAPGLAVVARAPDGIIEAVEMTDHPWLIGIQWHPEMTATDDPSQQRLFDELAKAAAWYAKAKSDTKG